MAKDMSGKIIAGAGTIVIIFPLVFSILKVRTGYNSLVFLGAILLVSAGIWLWFSTKSPYLKSE